MESRISTIKVLFQRKVMSLAVKVLSSVEDLSILIKRWQNIGSQLWTTVFPFYGNGMCCLRTRHSHGKPCSQKKMDSSWTATFQKKLFRGYVCSHLLVAQLLPFFSGWDFRGETLGLFDRQVTSQPTNRQPTNQPTNQLPTNQPTNKLANQSTTEQSVNLLINLRLWNIFWA
jgi:hypothetical protein